MTPYWINERHGLSIYHGDCLDVMPQLGREFDLCLTDPPYGIPAGSAFQRSDGVEDWGDAIQNVAVAGWIGLVPFATDAYCIEFGRNHPDATEEMIIRHRMVGLTPWHFIVIAKKACAPTPRPKFATGHEMAMVSFRGKRQWFGGGAMPDRWIGMTPNQLGKGKHPTEKPLEPIVMWMKALTAQTHTVLDPFLGSGTTLVACYRLGRQGVGIEISEEYCELAATRLEREIAQGRLFEPEEIAAAPKQLAMEATQ